MKEYWVDVETTGSFEDENEESFTEKTLGEGVADGFDLGLAPVDTTAHDPGDDPDEVTDLEDVEDDSASSKAKLKVPSKTDVEQEHALEAGIHIDTYDIHTATTKHSQKVPYNQYSISPVVIWEAIENVGNVMANMLKVQSKMEVARDKLAALGTKEASEKPSST